MNLLPWNKTKTDGKPAIPHLDDLLAEAAARAADIEGRMQALAFAVADGEEGAVEVLTKARADLREHFMSKKLLLPLMPWRRCEPARDSIIFSYLYGQIPMATIFAGLSRQRYTELGHG